MTQTPPISSPEETPQEPKQTPKMIADNVFKERDTYQQASTQQRSELNDIYSAYI